MFGKKRTEQEICASCDRGVKRDQKVCACGAATRHMDFAERTEYEVQQWRSYRQRAHAAS